LTYGSIGKFYGQRTYGIELERESMRSIAAIITNNTRRFNLREDLTLEEDKLPKRFYTEALPETG